MNYGKIMYCDPANGPGCRTVLFVSGCTHHCKGCFNPETWDFKFGQPFTRQVEAAVIRSLRNVFIDGLTVLGGEPMEQSNQEALYPFLRRVREESPKSTIWVYTGCKYELLADSSSLYKWRGDYTDRILDLIDVLVDGPFIEDERNLMLRFRGSSNQRIIDMPATRKAGHVVLSEYMA